MVEKLHEVLTSCWLARPTYPRATALTRAFAANYPLRPDTEPLARRRDLRHLANFGTLEGLSVNP